MKKRYYYFNLLILLFICNTAFAQLGSTCGIPSWTSTLGYSNGSYVKHDGQVYKNSVWVSGEEPGTGKSWVALGTCGEQLLIDNPNLAYTKGAAVKEWDNTRANYTTNDLVRFSNGIYRAKYWIAGTEQPDRTEAYKFLGVNVNPIAITPSYADKTIKIQSSLSSIIINATINTHGFSLTKSLLRIKKTTDANYTDYNMTVSNNTLSYNWTPSAYSDYDFQYVCINSVGVQTVENRIFKVAVSTPAVITLTSPVNKSFFNQLNFVPIAVSFQVTPANDALQSIVFKDDTSNTSTDVTIDSSNNYSFDWTPTYYGDNPIQIIATDIQGTKSTISFSYTIENPATENVIFDKLPFQLTSIHNIRKEFNFDKTIVAVKSRDLTLTNFSFTGTKLVIDSNHPGRTGLEIETSDGDKYYVGMRVDNADGSVPGLPEHISIGSVSEDISDDVNFFNNGINNNNQLLNNRLDVRYIYINGGPLIGWNTWQPDRATKFARNSLKMGLTPYFIFYNIPDGGESYTTNLGHIQDPNYMTAYFENLDLFLNQMKDVMGDEYFGIVLEPDFLGYMQQNSEPPTLPTSVSANSIGTNVGTLKTLVERINFEINKKRIDDKLNLQFGWQFNLWAKPNVAGIRGIIRETDSGDFDTKISKIEQTAEDIYEYGNQMGVMSSNADFVSIDKYGLDALGYRNSSNPADPSSYTWFWNNDHWLNYFKFVKHLHKVSNTHVILWQIPVGHINGSTTKNEYTGADFKTLDNTSKHYEDSASTFFFGDTVDFSTDVARFQYFSQNKHNDKKLVVDNTNKHVTFGNHFEELNDTGVRLVLMGAGVGDSTDGIGAPGTTLTDDHFWIQKVQQYYIKKLVKSTLGTDDIVVSHDDKTFLVYFQDEDLIVKNQSEGQKNVDVFLFDLQGRLVASTTNEKVFSNQTIKMKTPNLSNQIYVCITKNDNKLTSYKIIKQ